MVLFVEYAVEFRVPVAYPGMATSTVKVGNVNIVIFRICELFCLTSLT